MVIICDCYYRSSITAIRSFSNAGEEVIAVTTSDHKYPPSFSSKHIKEKHVLSSSHNEYKDQLIELCLKYDNPIIFPVGKFTLEIISKYKSDFNKIARFTVPLFELLNDLNDKKWVKEKAIGCGINVPSKFNLDNVSDFPVVVKPFCGEKFNLKAEDRYTIAYNRTELEQAYERYLKYDEQPIIEQYIKGQGIGVSVLFDNDSKPLTVFCHKRLAEYPINGGPSALLETFYDEQLINNTISFFEKSGLNGFAMAEYKLADDGYYLLEVNPRIWGSFPSTLPCHSNFITSYIRACNGAGGLDVQYDVNRKIKFSRGLIMVILSYAKKLNLIMAVKMLIALINPSIKGALSSFSDIKPTIRDFFRR